MTSRLDVVPVDPGTLSSLALVILAIAAFVLAFVVWALSDAVKHEDRVWRKAKESRSMWIGGLVVSAFFGFGLIVALLYRLLVQPKLKAASSHLARADGRR